MTFRLSEFRSEIVLLSFSSERCTRCSDSLPFLQDLYRRHQSDGVSVIDVDIDGNTRHSTDLAAELGLTFPILLDTGQSVSRLYDPDQLPLTLLIDREGRVRYVDKGFRGESQAQISAELNRLLAD
jgi:peroxiredoxin